MTAGLALDLVRAVAWLRAAYEAEAAGDDPRPAFARSQSAVSPIDLAEALGLALDALVRLTWDDPETVIEALCLDADLSSDLDAFTGAGER